LHYVFDHIFNMKKKGNTSLHVFRFFASVACILSGLLAGANIDRFLVQLPAWKYVDITSWAHYSRHADLGNGRWVYPLEAVGSFLILLVSSVIVWRKKPAYEQPSNYIYLGTCFAAIKLAITYFASPVILSLSSGNEDARFLQRAFDLYHFWSPYNVVTQLCCFICCLLAVGKLFVISGNPIEN
jgi:hypothetical protein